MYTFVVYTNIPAIKNLREAYIETAMLTLNHHWLAEFFFPQDMIDEVMNRVVDAEESQAGIISKWDDSKDSKAEQELESKKDFFELFSELEDSENGKNSYAARPIPPLPKRAGIRST